MDHLLMLGFLVSSRMKFTTRQRRILTAARDCPSPDERRDSRSCRCLALGNGGSPVPFIGESSRSRLARDGGEGQHNRVDGGFDEDADDAPLNTETFIINKLSASNQPILKQLSVFLKDKEDRISIRERKPEASEKRQHTHSSSCATTRKEVDPISTSIRMTLAMYSKALSSLTPRNRLLVVVRADGLDIRKAGGLCPSALTFGQAS